MRKICIMTILLLIASLMFMGCTEDSDDKSLTILQMKKLADKEIKKLDESGQFDFLYAHCKEHVKNGKYLEGRFTYYGKYSSGMPATITIKLLNGAIDNVSVTENSLFDYNNYPNYVFYDFSTIKLDSDEAYRIAINNDTNRELLSNDGVYHDTSSLYTNVQQTDNIKRPYYYFDWTSPDSSEIYLSFWTSISAETGEILDIGHISY